MAAALILFAGLVSQLWPWTADDAYTFFRYAANLAEGHGPTWDADLPRAEGYTAPAWVVLLTLPHLLGWDAEIFAKVAGVAATLAALGVLYRLAGLVAQPLPAPARRLAPPLAVLLLCSCPVLAVHATSGMETGLFLLALTGLVYLLAKAAREPRGRVFALLALSALAAALTRPEANLAAGVGLGVLWFVVPRERRRALLLACLLYVVPYTLYFAWRATYYGTLLPLPFYLKVASQAPLSGLGAVGSYLAEIGSRVGPLVVLGLLGARRALLPPLAAAASLLAFFAFPAHIMGYGWRYLYPLTPLVMAFAAAGLALVLAWLEARHGVRRVLRHGACAAALVLAPLWLLWQTKVVVATHRTYGAALQACHVALGKRLAAFQPSAGRPLLACSDAGAIPYFSTWRSLDTRSLNDRHIALTGEHDPGYVLAQEPDVVILVSQARDRFDPESELPWQQVLLDAADAAGYRRVKTLGPYAEHHYLWVLARPDTPIAAHLSRWQPDPHGED
ncbi:hypothetical protein HQ576_11365 [bacterium]|nr:hypothetical protein [bacterium]